MDSSLEVWRVAEKHASRMRRLFSAKMSKQQEDEVMAMLKQLIQLCVLPDDNEEPHTMNQTILVGSPRAIRVSRKLESGIMHVFFLNYISLCHLPGQCRSHQRHHGPVHPFYRPHAP